MLASITWDTASGTIGQIGVSAGEISVTDGEVYVTVLYNP